MKRWIPIVVVLLACVLVASSGFGAASKFQQLRVNQTVINSGYGLQVDRNLTAASTTQPLVYLLQDHASDDQPVLKIKQDGSGNAITVDYGATANVYRLGNTGIHTLAGGATLDNTTSATVLALAETTIRADGIVDFSAIGADTQTGLIGGAGAAASSTAVTTASAGKFLAFYGSTTATSGDSVMQYNRVYDNAASASTGTTIAGRAFTTVTTANGGNAHGTVSTASISGASSKISGVMSGVKAVVDLGTMTTGGPGQGSYYPLIIETQSTVTGQTPASFAYINARSYGAGAGTRPTTFAVLGDTGAEIGAGNGAAYICHTGLGTQNSTAGLRVRIDGVNYWFMLTTAGSP